MLKRLVNRFFQGNKKQSIGKYIPEPGDERMRIAIIMARESFAEVAEKLKDGTIDMLSVKLMATNGRDNYYYWVIEVLKEEGTYSGIINNEDRRFKEIKMGERIKFKETDIYDWMYEKDGKYFGNYTLKTMIYISNDQGQLEKLKNFGDI
jgi:uncharacterized protein YegJ (DUF2314 family)